MKLIRIKKYNRAGFTMVEVLISLFLVTVGITSSLLYFTTASASTKLARDITVATNHGEYVFEEMRAKATLLDIKNTNWQDFVTNNGLNTLGGETVTVTYADPDADPLNITVNINWTTHARNQSVNLITELTK